MKGLRNAQETAILVNVALASGQADSLLLEKVTALGHLCQELDLALEALARAYPEPGDIPPTNVR